jgi:hypothetical protein
VQARATLGLLIEAASQPTSEILGSRDPMLCPNCGATTASATSPYCSSFCKEESAFVRQLRRGLQDETLLNQDRQVFLAHAFWHVLGGGYPHRLPLIPESAKKQALKRTAGLCEVCQNPASTFDHKGSG